MGISPGSVPLTMRGSPPDREYKYPFSSGPMPTTDWPSGETANAIASTPSGEIAFGVPAEMILRIKTDTFSRFIPRKDKALAARQPARPLVVDRIVSERLGFTRAGGQEAELFGRTRRLHDDPFLVGRKSVGCSFAQSNRRGAICVANVDRVSQFLRIAVLHPAANSLFIKEDGLAVGGKVGGIGVVQPGKVSLLGRAVGREP